MEKVKRAVLLMEGPVCKPLVLQPVLFCPVIQWLCETLKERGVTQWLIYGAGAYRDEIAAHITSVEGVTVADEPLDRFLDTPQHVLFIDGAVLPEGGLLPHSDTGVCCGVGRECSDPKDFMRTAQRQDGFTALRTMAELHAAQTALRMRMAQRLIDAGVLILDTSAVYIDPRVKIGAGTTLLPGTILRGRTVIGENCEIGPNSMICDCVIGDSTTVNASQVNESSVGRNTKIGPFAYVRPGCVIGDEIKVGDFVEVKNSTLGSGTKISHLTYVGDSDVGSHVNFGCGTVTVNYDGQAKYRCHIGDHAFLGCNTNLVAPVHVGDGAYTAAGSTITSDVPDDALGVARARQRNLSDWSKKRRAAGRLK